MKTGSGTGKVPVPLLGFYHSLKLSSYGSLHQGFLFTFFSSSGVRQICSPCMDWMFVSTAKP